MEYESPYRQLFLLRDHNCYRYIVHIGMFRLRRGLLQWVKSVDHARLMLSAGGGVEIITSHVVSDFAKLSSTSWSTLALGAPTAGNVDGIVGSAAFIEIAVHAQIFLVS